MNASPIPAAIVSVGGMGLVAAAAPAFAQSPKDEPVSKQSETPEPEGLQTRAANIPSRRSVDRSSASRMDPRPDHSEASCCGSDPPRRA